MVSVRSCTDSDTDAIVKVLEAVYEKDAYPQGSSDFRKFVTHGLQQAWVAESKGTIIGHVAIAAPDPSDLAIKLWREQKPDEDGCIVLVKRLFVAPEARGKGAASSLLEAASGWGEENGVKLILWTLVKDVSAIGLYDRLGWKQFGTGVFHFGENREKSMKAICFVNRDPSN